MSVNALVEKGILAEQKCGSNFAYTLLEDGLFLPTEYKVLRSQDDQCFLKCMKLTYNGQIQFYYLLEDYRSLAQMLPSLDADIKMDEVPHITISDTRGSDIELESEYGKGTVVYIEKTTT